MAGLVHGLAIIRLLAEERESLSLSEIARRLKLGKPTTLRLLATLVATGYVAQDPATKTYTADYQVLELSAFLLLKLELRARAMPYLFDLARATELAALITVLSRGWVVTLDRVSTRKFRPWRGEVGTRTPAHVSSAGKVLLAQLRPDELEAYLAGATLTAHTPSSITSPERLREELAQVREQGYGLNREEWVPKVWSVAAPVRNYAGQVVGAVAVSNQDLLPEGWYDDAAIRQHLPALLAAAEDISYSLGYHANSLVLAGSTPVRGAAGGWV